MCSTLTPQGRTNIALPVIYELPDMATKLLLALHNTQMHSQLQFQLGLVLLWRIQQRLSLLIAYYLCATYWHICAIEAQTIPLHACLVIEIHISLSIYTYNICIHLTNAIRLHTVCDCRLLLAAVLMWSILFMNLWATKAWHNNNNSENNIDHELQ